MDFGKSDYGTVDAVEKSVTVHLRDPFDDTYMIYDFDLESPVLDGDGKQVLNKKGNPVFNRDKSKPVTFGVKHVRCEAGKAVAKRFERMAAKGIKVDPTKLGVAVIAAITTGWTHVDNEDGPIECTEENVTKFVTEYIDFFPQLSAVASDLTNYGVDAELFTKSPKP